MSAPQKRLGDCLALKYVFICMFISVSCMSDGSKNRVPMFVSIVCYVFVILWLECQRSQNGRQGQRLQDAVNKKSDSRTRSRSDSVSFRYHVVLCRMALGHISKFQVLYAKFRYLVTRLSNTKKGRQELGLWHLVHKKVNSGTWPERDSA